MLDVILLARKLFIKITRRSAAINRLLWVLLVVKIIAVGLIIKNRKDNLALSAPISYQQLYSNGPKISTILREGASMVVVTTKSSIQDKQVEKGEPDQNTNIININIQSNPIEVQEGWVKIDNKVFKIRFSLQDLDGSLASPEAGWVYLVSTDIGIDLFARGRVNWFKAPPNVSKIGQNIRINNIISNAIKATCGQRGKPTKTTECASLDQLEKKIEIEKSLVWCEQIAKYCQHKLCNEAKTRVVTIGDSREISSGIRNSGHTMLELYSYENGRWYAVDPTLGILSFRSASNEPLNTIEILLLNRDDQDHLLGGLICEYVDLKTGQLDRKRYEELEDSLKNDIKNRYKFNDLVVFHTEKSLIYDRSFLNKVATAFSTQRQFHFAWNSTFWSMCDVRAVLLKSSAVIASLIAFFKALTVCSSFSLKSGGALWGQDDAVRWQ